MPVSDEDRAALDAWTSAADQHLRSIVAQNNNAQTHPLVWAANMKIREARLHIERYLCRHDELSPPSVFQRTGDDRLIREDRPE